MLNRNILAAGGKLRPQDVFATVLSPDVDAIGTEYGTSFAPDFEWGKTRSAAGAHRLLDKLRGDNAIDTSSTAGNAAITTGLAPTGSRKSVKKTISAAASEVHWAFKFAPKFCTAVPYTGNGVSGRVISHDLGAAVGFIVIKRLDVAANWVARHISSTGVLSEFFLNTTDAKGAAGNQISAVSDTNFTVFNDAAVNAASGSYIAYLFAHDTSPGSFIKWGAYTGNGTTTGPVVTLDWEPQWLIVKAATTTGAWYITDAARTPSNTRTGSLTANGNGAESASSVSSVDFLSTGFQPRTGSVGTNSSGQTYIYGAIRKPL